MKTKYRRYDLDWMRVFAVLTIFIYHTTRFFNSEDWFVKNPSTFLAMDIMETVLANWIMALIFVISGASIFYALDQGSTSQFIQAKILRLMVPMVTLGMVLFGAPQIYLGRVVHGQYTGSLIEFLPSYFRPENFPWSGVHLWYLGLLFIFSVLSLPLFVWLKQGHGQHAAAKLGDILARSGAIYLLALPTILALMLTTDNSLLGRTDWGGGSILTHATFFISGFLIISQQKLQENIQRFRWLSLALVLMLFITIFGLYISLGYPTSGTPLYAIARVLWGLWAWSWVLALLGFGMKHLNQSRPGLSYANQAVLPFYILHHPILLGVGYWIVRWPIPSAVKFVAIDIISLALILALYELCVRRFNPIRFLFGMKMRSGSPGKAIQLSEPAAAFQAAPQESEVRK